VISLSLRLSTATATDSLKNSVPTRWNSVLTMISSIVDLKEVVDETLKCTGNSNLRLSAEEFELLNGLREFLEPFERYTQSVSGGTTSAHASLSLVMLIKEKIKQKMMKIVSRKTSLEAIAKLADSVLQSLDKRLKVNETVKLATLLDPSTRPLLISTRPTEITQGSPESEGAADSSGEHRNLLVNCCYKFFEERQRFLKLKLKALTQSESRQA
jgi:hypothetical protein